MPKITDTLIAERVRAEHKRLLAWVRDERLAGRLAEDVNPRAYGRWVVLDEILDDGILFEHEVK